MKLFWSILFFLILLGVPCSAFGSASSANIPLNSTIYQDLDKLSGLGLVDSGLQGFRPYTRLEAARLVTEARQNAAGEELLPVVQQLLQRLENELHDQLVELHTLEGGAPDSYFKPLRSLDLEYIFQNGEPSIYPKTNARQFSLDYNDYGIDHDQKSSGRLSFATELRLDKFFLLEARPLLEIKGGEQVDPQLLEGRVALGLGPVEVSFGRQALWWGEGRHGSLVLTNNAKPLDMLRFTNPSPIQLPWIFKYLGPFRFDVFWSRLEKERVVSEPYFAGLRLDVKPLPWFELGASRTIIFGGKGRPNVGWSDFLTILGGKNLNGKVDTSDSVAAIDFRLKFPFLYRAELYGEVGGEDEAGHWLANTAWLGGLFLPRIEPTGRLSLRFEYADLSHVDNNSPVWYRHGIYKSGYTYDQNILGHHVGGAGKDCFTELRILFPDDLTLHLSLDLETRGYDQPVREEHRQPEIGITWQLRSNIALTAAYAYDQVENFGFSSNNDRNFYSARVGTTTTW